MTTATVVVPPEEGEQKPSDGNAHDGIPPHYPSASMIVGDGIRVHCTNVDSGHADRTYRIQPYI